ncbi:MAG TPA: RNA polymerase sigma-70 factor [Prolixibacteraceae bacterium]|nr:RNA polymerase sigma-70 factor [Prolixibacteraceae bacterium]
MKVLQADGELIEKLRKGDVGAFDQVYKKYAGRLYAFSLKYLKSKEESEELVQSVFLKVWENQNNLKKDTSFKSYLFTIAYNEVCNIFRRRINRQKFMNETLAGNWESSDESEKQIDYQFVLEQIEQIIARLPEKQRLVFRKSREEGKSSKEIAAELGLSSGTVDNYVSESIKFIRNNLQEKHFSVCLFFSLFFF